MHGCRLSVHAHSLRIHLLFLTDAGGAPAGRPGRRAVRAGRALPAALRGVCIPTRLLLFTLQVVSDCFAIPCLPGSSVHGISKGRILEWVAIPFSRGSS